VAHEVMRPKGPAYEDVVKAFGSWILTEDGAIDRKRLGEIVFRDPDAMQRLERAVHPKVIVEVDRRIAEASGPVIVVEAIKLIEAGMHRSYDSLWVVTAPRPRQIGRLMRERGLNEPEAALRVDAQPPQTDKAALADRVIVNDSSLEELRAKVLAAWMQIPASVRARARAGVPDGSG
jgi:dephospho-CoA kinase